MEEKNVKTVLEGNAFYEVDLQCKREKKQKQDTMKKQQITPMIQRKRQRY